MTATIDSITGDDVGTDAIRIRGARTHNLRNVDVDLPLGKLIVITGVSGSGKSSLAFDTLFAEGQRRYLESVSVHTRSLLKQLPRPAVDEVSGLPPTVSVDQRVTTAPARSTLAVTTEIYDYLRLLYARAGKAHCTNCGQPVESQSVDEVVAQVLQRPDRTKLMILSPMVRSRRGAHKDVFERIGRSGFVRIRVNGELLDISDVPDLAPGKEHCVDAVIDRIILKNGIEQRLRESIELAVRESDGTCIVCEQIDGQWQDELFSTNFSCADCNLSFPTPEPRTFSFNSAWGACEECEGFGIRGVADDSEEITVFRRAACSVCHGSRLQSFARAITFLDKSIAEFTALSVEDALTLTESWQAKVDNSENSDDTLLIDLTREAALVARRTLPDIHQRLECLRKVGVGYLSLNRPTRTLSGGEFQRARLSACLGTGLHGACFVLDEPTSGLHPRDTQRLLKILCEIRDAGATVVVVEHDGEVMKAADHLIDLGPNAGIEGGELMFSGPPAESASACESPTAQYLRGTLPASPPAAEVTPQSSEQLFRNSPEITSVAGFAGIREPGAENRILAKPATSKREVVSGLILSTDEEQAPQRLTVSNARCNNLQNVDVSIPLRQLVCVTGVSGSGKSSLIIDTLLPIAEAHCQRDGNVKAAAADAQCGDITGLEHIQRVVAVDNSPLGRNRRSCIATYSKLWTDVRKLFAKTKDSRARGFDARRFSFNTGDGRCSACKGTGLKDVKMTFLPDATVPCPECCGQRFNRATLAVRFAGKNVADVLNMRVDEAVEFFGELGSLRKLMETFRSVGLGYLTLGQQASTFSGGEAQRVKLATELAAERLEPTLFVLDEPTSGLHPADVVHLNSLLRSLVTAGHSVIVVEHNVDVMLASDWIIDIGPESGAAGGMIVAEGDSAAIKASADSRTGVFLS